ARRSMLPESSRHGRPPPLTPRMGFAAPTYGPVTGARTAELSTFRPSPPPLERAGTTSAAAASNASMPMTGTDMRFMLPSLLVAPGVRAQGSGRFVRRAPRDYF